jgi:putative ABC transport system ATP-binding protein
MAEHADVVESAPQRVRYVAGETVFEQGDRADLVYMIEEGSVDVLRVNADGSEERLTSLGPGQYFGELGALLGYPRSASIRATTDLVLTAYGPQTFRSTILSD